MKNYILRKCKGEKGMLVVEAAIVFPVMFIILLMLIFFGNAYFIRAEIDSLVLNGAIDGANYSSDPILYNIQSSGGDIPSLSDLRTEPYRYVSSSRGIRAQKLINDRISKALGENNFSFFKNMRPKLLTSSSNISKFNNHILYSDFSVELHYKLKMPIKMFGAKEFYIFDINAYAISPVSDTTEFIRNTDMTIDLFQGTMVGKAISDVFNKVNTFLQSIAKLGQ